VVLGPQLLPHAPALAGAGDAARGVVLVERRAVGGGDGDAEGIVRERHAQRGRADHAAIAPDLDLRGRVLRGQVEHGVGMLAAQLGPGTEAHADDLGCDRRHAHGALLVAEQQALPALLGRGHPAQRAPARVRGRGQGQHDQDGADASLHVRGFYCRPTPRPAAVR
jgi:hypothetical protein